MRLFKRKEKQLDVSCKFRQNVQKAITLLLKSNNSPTDEMVLELFQKNGISKADSVEILIFLPIAFLRRLYDHLNWHDSYFEFDDKNNRVEKKFADSESFQIIEDVTDKYFQNLPVSPNITNIAWRSAEFNALNDILLKNPGMKAEDVLLSKTFIVR
jgi:UDP-N-acetylmuramoylalanine-D-glutamate ligase